MIKYIKDIVAYLVGMLTLGAIRRMLLTYEYNFHNDSRCNSAGKLLQMKFVRNVKSDLTTGNSISLAQYGFRNYSQFEEDGILLALFTILGISQGHFIDIGANDGINSNVANLAINHGWTGLMIEGNPSLVRRGTTFYKNHPDTWFMPPKFINCFVTAENINSVIATAGYSGTIDLLCIDIDGNDYWIWKAIGQVSPTVVIIECQIKHGLTEYIPPYDANHRASDLCSDAPGASAKSLISLADELGYRLVATSRNGVNLIFLDNRVHNGSLSTMNIEDVFD